MRALGLLIVLSWIGLQGCTGETVAGNQVTSDADASWDAANDVTSDSQSADRDALVGDPVQWEAIVAVDSPGFEDVKFLEGSAECIPDGSDGVQLGACCSHQSCQGQCVELDDGSEGCWCLGLMGGCPDGLICCKYRGGCTDPHHCAP